MHFSGVDIRAVELHTGNAVRLTAPEVDDRTQLPLRNAYALWLAENSVRGSRPGRVVRRTSRRKPRAGDHALRMS